jgi:hypothetical protein
MASRYARHLEAWSAFKDLRPLPADLRSRSPLIANKEARVRLGTALARCWSTTVIGVELRGEYGFG